MRRDNVRFRQVKFVRPVWQSVGQFGRRPAFAAFRFGRRQVRIFHGGGMGRHEIAFGLSEIFSFTQAPVQILIDELLHCRLTNAQGFNASGKAHVCADRGAASVIAVGQFLHFRQKPVGVERYTAVDQHSAVWSESITDVCIVGGCPVIFQILILVFRLFRIFPFGKQGILNFKA